MSLDYKIKEDVKVKKEPLNFKSYSFLKKVAKIKEENELLDKACKPDYQKMLRRIEI